MKHPGTIYPLILAIAPSTRGFGYAVLEGQDILVDWGVKSVTGDKNAQCLIKVKEMMTRYQPSVLVLENASAKDSRRSPRIRTLTQKIAALASRHHVQPVLFSRSQVKRVFFADGGEGTKHTLAEKIANRFPQELGLRLPPKRRAWESEYARMDIFAAVALALVFRREERKSIANSP